MRDELLELYKRDEGKREPELKISGVSKSLIIHMRLSKYLTTYTEYTFVLLSLLQVTRKFLLLSSF